MVYSYTRFLQDEQPAPCLNITIINPDNRNKSISINALIDTGSDVTLIPWKRLKRIGLVAAGSSMEMQGLGGSVDLFPFVVLLTFDQRTNEQEVWGWDEEFALIGRNILKDCTLNLDGPYQDFEIVFA